METTIGRLTKAFIYENSLFKEREAELKDKCIFYTGVTTADFDNENNNWIKKEPDRRLSRYASIIGYVNNKQTIWVRVSIRKKKPGREVSANSIKQTMWPGDYENVWEGKEPDCYADSGLRHPGSCLQL
jgi:hypothetical protein